MTQVQQDWRFCNKCNTMFFDGFADNKGACPADGGPHAAQGYMFVLEHDVPEVPNTQGAWRFCNKCSAMFFDGFPTKGKCDRDLGDHVAQGFVFVLPHDVPSSPTQQTAWRFCNKCFVMFFDGFDAKGHCAAGDVHTAEGFMFALPHLPDGPAVPLDFNTGPLTSSLPLGGSAHLVVNGDGRWTWNTHAHDSGFDNIDYSMAAALVSPEGATFTFAVQGKVEGTIADPLGGARRGDDQLRNGSSPDVQAHFGELGGAKLVAHLVGTDTLVNGIEDLITQAVEDAVKQVGAAAAAAVVALV
ncbi:hypothetical protein acdb102_00980 [Acidothermaceae bacterium B102]|nr:hypothetical protein acdb102_00980 [Acidothermaceae bacterium B102]